MEREEYNRQATEIADILKAQYPVSAYSPNFTLWGVAFRWDGSVVDDERKGNPFYGFIPATFGLIENVHKPGFLPPRARSIPMHFSMLCLANRDAVEGAYKGALEEAGYSSIDDVMAIVSDKRLANEAVQRFVELRRSGKIGEDIDVITFLLHYNVENEEMSEDRKKQKGTFVPLATRLAYRHDEDGFEEGLFNLADAPTADDARKLHYTACPKPSDAAIDETVHALYAKHVVHNGASPVPDMQKVTGVGLCGKRKVVLYGGKGNIRWAALEEMHRARRLSYKAFDPNEVLRARVENALTESFLKEYQLHGNIQIVAERIDESIARAESDEERQILRRVRKKFKMMGRFDSLDIKHEMPVTIKRGNGEK